MQKCRQHICLPTKLIDLIDFIDKIHTYTVCRLPISLCGNPCIVMASHYISYMFFKSNHHISWMPSSHGSMERTQKAGDEITCMINNILMHEPVISLIGYMDIHQFGLDIYMPILVKPTWKQFCIVVIIIYIYIITTPPHSTVTIILVALILSLDEISSLINFKKASVGWELSNTHWQANLYMSLPLFYHQIETKQNRKMWPFIYVHEHRSRSHCLNRNTGWYFHQLFLSPLPPKWRTEHIFIEEETYSYSSSSLFSTRAT